MAAALHRVDGWGVEVSGGAWGERAWPGDVGDGIVDLVIVEAEVSLAMFNVVHSFFELSPPVFPEGGWEHCSPPGAGSAETA